VDVEVPTSILMSPALAFYEQKIHLFYCAQSGSKWAIGEALANPEFVSNGFWESKPISGKYKILQMVYEKPPNTDIKVYLSENNKRKLLSADSEIKYPYQRKKAKFNLPENVENLFKIKLEFLTKNSESSPVVYSINLAK